MEKLKPIMFVKDGTERYRNNVFQQNILLKALRHTDNLDDLKKVAQFHSKAEVIRTLDKLSIRKGFHDALANNGLSLDFIVGGIKEICESTSSDKVKLGAYNTLLKSLGLDKYDVIETGGRNWEDIIMKVHEKEQVEKLEEGVREIESKEYEVNIPIAPESEKIKEKEEKKIGQSIYE